MSYISNIPKNTDWAIYREDCRPSWSHIYHENCPNRPEGSGEYFAVSEHICDDCGEPVPHMVLAVLRIVCAQKADKW
jgi:hypothetical protein